MLSEEMVQSETYKNLAKTLELLKEYESKLQLSFEEFYNKIYEQQS